MMYGFGEIYNNVTVGNYGTSEKLPVGGYVVRILQVEEKSYSWGNVIVFSFDIAEGEYREFFKRNYNEQPGFYEKKWKGTYRLTIPAKKGNTPDDQKKFERQLGFFKGQIEAFNVSNNININCAREWDPQNLKGRFVGALFGEAEWEVDGRSGLYTCCDRFIPVEKVRSGDFEIPPVRRKRNNNSASLPPVNSAPSAASGSSLSDLGDLSDFEEILSDGEVPF